MGATAETQVLAEQECKAFDTTRYFDGAPYKVEKRPTVVANLKSFILS